MLRLLVDIRFQVLFHSPPGVLFTFPSRYYALSVHISISPWRVVPPASHKVPRAPWYSGYYPIPFFTSTGLSPSSPGALLSKRGDSTTTAGFPHSEICGSLVTCTLPQLIAAYRVLLRLIWPRHPPYALTYLTYLLSFLRFELSNFLKRSFFVSYVFM